MNYRNGIMVIRSAFSLETYNLMKDVVDAFERHLDAIDKYGINEQMQNRTAAYVDILNGIFRNRFGDALSFTDLCK